jgi:hypothetical protein
VSRIRSSAASSSTGTPSDWALASFEPASAPTTRKLVFFETLPELPAAQGAGDHERQARQRQCRGALHVKILPADSGLAQPRDHLTCLWVGEESRHLGGNHWPDIGRLFDLLRRGVHQVIEIAELLRQRACGGLAHLRNAEPEQEPRQRGVLAVLDRLDDVPGGLLAQALTLRQCFRFERVQIGRRADRTILDQLLDEFLAQAFYIHGI